MVKSKGERYSCEDCGLVVVVEDACGCGDECQIMCCQKPMKQQKGTASSSKSAMPKSKMKSEDKTKTKGKP